MKADEYQEAIRRASYAYYKYSDLDEYAALARKRYTPKLLQEHGAVIAALVTLGLERRLSFKFTF